MGIPGRFLALCLLFHSIWTSCATSDKDGQFCVSQGGRFPSFVLEGKPPRKSVKGPDDLTACRIYRKRTCCTSEQTYPALLSIRRLASSGEGSDDCILFWEAMECALCDPSVGVRRGPPKLCNSLCEAALDACRDAFFSFDEMNQVLQPCGPKDIICAQASQWAANGTQFCSLAGFVVPDGNSAITSSCFDGKPTLDTDFAATTHSEKKSTYRKKQWAQRLVRYIKTQVIKGDVIIWAVGGLVLTAGIIFMRRQSLSSQRKKTAMQRLVKEARSKQHSVGLANTKRRS